MVNRACKRQTLGPGRFTLDTEDQFDVGPAVTKSANQRIIDRSLNDITLVQRCGTPATYAE